MQSLLRWLTALVQPFTHWCVPVVLLRGRSRVSGREVLLLSAGRERCTKFITSRLFAQEPVVVRRKRVPVWRLQRLLNQWHSAADLTVIGIDRVSARLFLGDQYLAIPQWISSWMKVPEDLKAFSRVRKSVAGDIRRIHAKKFDCQLSRDDRDFDLFYEKFYRPYVIERHNDMSMVSPRWMTRFLFKRGMIMWISKGGERQAGGINTVKGTTYIKHVNGVLDGRLDLLRDGALSSLYVHSILEARRLGCAVIHMGGSLPSLHDGVFRYKSKWAAGLCPHAGFLSANLVTLLRWNRLAGPVAEFLNQTSLIHHDQDGYSALWAFSEDMPLTGENLKQKHAALKAAGLHRFRILIPGKAPPDFVCPPGLNLIELSMAEQVGAGGINGLG